MPDFLGDFILICCALAGTVTELALLAIFAVDCSHLPPLPVVLRVNFTLAFHNAKTDAVGFIDIDHIESWQASAAVVSIIGPVTALVSKVSSLFSKMCVGESIGAGFIGAAVCRESEVFLKIRTDV